MKSFSVRGLQLQRSWVVVAGSSLVMFGVWNAHGSFGVFLPVLSQEFDWSRGAVSLAPALNLVTGGVLAFAFGIATDRYGPGRPLALGAFLVGLSYLLVTRVSELWQFYLVLGFLVGIGMSGMYLVPTATVSRWFVGQRGLALGVVLAGLNVAYVSGPPLSAFLISGLGWRPTYLLLGFLVWAIAFPAALLIKAPPPGAGPLPGHGFGGAAKAGGGGPPAAEGATFREALRDLHLWVLVLSWLFQGFAHMMIAIHVVAYIKDVGVSLERASLALTTYGVSSIIGRIAFGAAADRLGSRPTFWLCLGLQLGGLLGLMAGPSLGLLYLLVAAFGMGSAGTDTIIVKSTSEVFGVRAVGAIMGVLSLGWRVGAASGPAAAGYIYDATGSYIVAFALGSAALALSLPLFNVGTRRLARAPRLAGTLQ